ncbi:PAS domain-containing sensor histidine kinase [Polycladomyces abyssicola]|uniref:histidine kinase n=1 Tax=Polycladomyces abyssicola TaxID=1125966 RepID=A0A8D5UJY3_9BACL|nr:ATP-binding protein [Polycladomyces abyssicola]BCU83378.1 PAS domain-containing sensor histidine kinase [Polycladomyces abyssicola]
MKRWFRMFQSIQWKLVVIYLSLILIAMQLTGVYLFRSLEKYYFDEFNKTLEKQIRVLTTPPDLSELLSKGVDNQKEINELNQLVQQLFTYNKGQATVQVVDKDGIVVSTTGDNKSVIGQKNLKATQALESGRRYGGVRIDPATGFRMKVVAVPIQRDRRIVGAVYLEVSMEEMYDTINRISITLIKIPLATMSITSLLWIIIARTISSPVKAITQQATAMAEGDFNRQVEVKSNDEIGQLATAFNHLAQHLRDALSQNEEEKKKLESVLANMSDGVLAFDREGKTIVSNQPAEEMLGKPIPLGQPINDVLPLSDPIALPLEEERVTYLEMNPDDTEEMQIIKITLTPIQRSGQKMVGLIAVLQDVTEEEKLDRRRKEFVANVSHELRTPLTTIKSYLEALDDGAMNEPELAKRFLSVTLQEADRMARLIQDLLHLSRLDAKQTRFNKKPTDLRCMLEKVVERFSVPCQQKEINLKLQIIEPLPRVYVDRDQMDQVMDNLLSNAVKYTPEGGTITVRARRRSDGSAEVSVSDTGIGIPKKDLARIFERFYRVDKARSRSMGGTGLGLSIAKEIVQAHGGQIGIDSEYQRGTTVYFSLPPCEPEVVR